MERRAFAIILVVAAATLSLLAGRAPAEPRLATPSAAEFATDFAGVVNAYAVTHGEMRRVVNPQCIQASPRHYMCSHATVRAGAAAQCHLMQAEWRPEALSTIKVMLAGRVSVCDSLAHALRSLG
jgi:hypothetical protein